MSSTTATAIRSVADTLMSTGEGIASWRDAAAHAAKLMHADSACLLWRDKHTREVIATEFVEVPESALKTYSEYYADRDCLARKFSYSPAGTRFITNTVVSRHDRDDHEFVFDFLHPNGIEEIQGFVIYSDQQHVVSISFLRERMQAQSDDLALREKSLFFSINQAFLSHAQRSKHELHHLASLLQPQTHCWMIVNEAGQLLENAQHSFAQLKHGGSLDVKNHKLSHRTEAWQARLMQTLKQVADDAQEQSLLIPDDWGRSYRLHISRAPARYSFGFRQLLLVRLECRSIFNVPSADVLKDYFNLTPTEAQICHYVVAGLTLKDTAEVLQISPETARKHLASIFQKTECSRQSELQRLVASL